MINLLTNTIELDNPTIKAPKPIDHWEVWFMSPFGVHKELPRAMEVTQNVELDPNLYVKPVAVAIASDGTYEVRH